MRFSEFSAKINYFSTAKLGGQPSQFKLAPALRVKFSEEKIKHCNPKRAAVLALFYPDANNDARFLLTERASYRGVHSKQISFTGGKIEPTETAKQAAIRETVEEVGIPSKEIRIIRQLSETYIPPSNFLVTPFLGMLHSTPRFYPNYEVASVIEVLVADLLNNTNLSSVTLETSYMKQIEVPCFTLNGHIVWGATAMMLSEIKDLIAE